jgi:hypothetical protein
MKNVSVYPKIIPVEIRVMTFRQVGVGLIETPEYYDYVKMRWCGLPNSATWYGPIDMPE